MRDSEFVRWHRWLAVVLLLLLFTQLVTSAVVKSASFDEPFHGVYGYIDITTGDWRMHVQNPPFVHLLTGATLLVLPDRPDPRELPAWSAAFHGVDTLRQLIDAFGRPLDVLIFPQRVVVMGLTLLLGAVLFRWATEQHGPLGGILALAMYAFAPNILAHGRIVTTDLAFACCFFVSVYTFQRLLKQPSVGRCVLAGAALGSALGSKMSAFLLIPVFVLIILLRDCRGGLGGQKGLTGLGEWCRRVARDLGWLALSGLLAVLVVWALYGFEMGPWSTGWPWLPAPTYVKGLLAVREHGVEGHEAFLMGHRSYTGWPEYFAVTLAVKTPLPILLGAAMGGVYLLLRRRQWALLVGALPALLFFIAATLFTVNIGYRHILPVLPFLILLASALAGLLYRRSVLFVVGGAILWLVVGTTNVHPDYLAYFNELAGGPSGGHRYLTDSNLDWGQDLVQLQRYLEGQGIEEVYLSYFGNVDPVEYGISYKPLASYFSLGAGEDFFRFAPLPGVYALSVTNLSGQYPLGDPDVLDWFNHRLPVASIGHSINVYRVQAADVHLKTVAQCNVPVSPLDGEAILRGFGSADLRRVDFDCTEAWLYPGGGIEPVVYALHHDLLPDHSLRFPLLLRREPSPDDPFVARHLADTQMSFEQQGPATLPAFVLYRWDTNRSWPASYPAYAAPAATLPQTLEDADVASIPVSLRGPLAFLGASMVRETESIEVETWWQVVEGPIDRPFSVMAHLMTAGGEVLGAADGLGVDPIMLLPGDIVVQRHRFAGLAGETDVWLRTGAYWLDSMERWEIAGAVDADVLLLDFGVVR